jgi:predicted N-acyltransferase
MNLLVIDSIAEVSATEWDSLNTDGNPFNSHTFLLAAEQHHATTAEMGWYPRHLILKSDDDTLLAVVPLFARTHSFGDFSHDWSWSSAFERMGLRYYPKLVSGHPYTPTSGPRFLIGPDADHAKVRDVLLEAAMELTQELDASCWQALFLRDEELQALKAEGLLLRRGYQFHWYNREYRDFEDFLATFSADKRKKAKRERRRVEEAGLAIKECHGDEISPQLWMSIHRHYLSTFIQYGNHAAFSREFFMEVGQSLGKRMVLFLAYEGERHVATAICYRDNQTLYGRHWGADADYHSLHFELCLYRGIDYCIRHGLQRFEPGAQGEHKLSRGFMPIDTWSAFWVRDTRMRQAIGDFLKREQHVISAYQDEMAEHAPFKSA